MGRFATLSLLTSLAVGLGAARLVAHEPVIGGEVRLTTPARTLIGTLGAITERAIVVQENGAPVEIARSELLKFEVMNPGRKAHLAIWGGSGLAAGALFGVGLRGVIDAICLDCSNYEPKSAASYAVVGALSLGTVGLIIGKVAERRPHWEEVEIGPKLRVEIMPVAGRGARVAIALSF